MITVDRARHQAQPALELRSWPASGRRDRAAPPLLFIHGAYTAAWMWEEHFLPWFSERGFECHAVSLRGHGDSEGGARLDSASLRDYVSDVQRTARSLERPPVLIGHSMGGMVVQKCLETGATPPAAALLAPVPIEGLGWSIARMGFSRPLTLMQVGLLQSGFGAFVDSRSVSGAVFSDDLPAPLRDAYGARTQPESARALMDMLGMDLPNRRKMGELPPMLVVGAGRDAFFTSHEAAATARFYNAELTVEPGLAHAVMLEPGWERVARRLRSWLEEQFPTGA